MSLNETQANIIYRLKGILLFFFLFSLDQFPCSRKMVWTHLSFPLFWFREIFQSNPVVFDPEMRERKKNQKSEKKLNFSFDSITFNIQHWISLPLSQALINFQTRTIACAILMNYSRKLFLYNSKVHDTLSVTLLPKAEKKEIRRK